MYLPFHSTAAIFVGGIIRYILDFQLKREEAEQPDRAHAVNTGVLLSSGLIAGEALMAVILAFLVLGFDLMKWKAMLPKIWDNAWMGMLIFPFLTYVLVRTPLKAMRKRKTPETKAE